MDIILYIAEGREGSLAMSVVLPMAEFMWPTPTALRSHYDPSF
jgi:hypothetical protein